MKTQEPRPVERNPGTNPILADLRTLRGELELQIHLGGMEARDTWAALEKRYRKLEQTAEAKGAGMIESVSTHAEQLLEELKALRLRLRSAS